ncbi:ABC transporter permease [Phytohabitans sp. LJ34]|uniref:ABC transporter permease n=1 Tax=Phytohabitans sp. LJ34 TaxID=3452217 RepID=UPI003F89C3DA
MTGLVGTGMLARLVLRRERVVTAVWVPLLAVVLIGFAAGVQWLYPTAASRQEFTASVADNPSLVAMYGPVFSSSIGGLAAWRSVFVLLGAAIAALLTVVRHTRADEEVGRRELLGSTAVGRHASAAAALVVTFGSTAALATLIVLGLIGRGLPVAGSVAEGLAVAAVGMVFGAVAVLCAQLTESARSARGIAAAVLGGAFLLRVIGDLNSDNGLSWLSWTSPFGLVQRVRPFADERWWLFAPIAALVALLVGLAFAVESRRDLGAGLLPARLGPAAGGPRLSSPYALAWRLHRGALFAWTAAFAVGGLVVGGAAQGAVRMLDDNPRLRVMFERLGGSGAAADTFLAVVLVYIGTVAALYAIQAVLRLRGEELEHRAEPLLATPVSRLEWTVSHLGFAFGGPVLLMAAAGAGAGVVRGAANGDVAHHVAQLLGAALAQLPAVWVLPGLAIAAFGLVPRWAPLVWAAVAFFALLGEFGAMLDLNGWLLDVSPFHHVPRLPGGTFAATPLIWLTVISGSLVLVGLIGVRRRDIG